MKDKFKNAWNWVKEHKVEIGLAALCVATAAAGVVVFKQTTDPEFSMKCIKDTNSAKEKKTDWPKMLPIPDLGVGMCTDAVGYENGSVELWLDNVKLSSMGDLGEDILCQYPDLANGEVWALMNIRPGEET